MEKIIVGGVELSVENGALYSVAGQEKDLVLPERITEIRPKVFQVNDWLETIQGCLKTPLIKNKKDCWMVKDI